MSTRPVTRPVAMVRPAMLVVLRADGRAPFEFPFEVDLRRLSPVAIAACLAAAGEAADTVVPGLASCIQVEAPDRTRIVVSRSPFSGMFEPENPAYEVFPPTRPVPDTAA